MSSLRKLVDVQLFTAKVRHCQGVVGCSLLSGAKGDFIETDGFVPAQDSHFEAEVVLERLFGTLLTEDKSHC